MTRTNPITALATVVACLWTAAATAQVPDTLRYQGYLTDAGGQALDTAVSVTFNLYTVETGGVPLWTATQVVVPSQGLFSTALGGATNPFPPGLFDTPLYIGIQVGTDPEMTPRVTLASTAYSQKALDAETVGGIPASALDQSVEVTSLQSTTGLLQARVVAAEGDIDSAEAEISGLLGNVGQLQTDVGANLADIGQLQADLVTTNNDLNTVENALPNLQARVTGTCGAGSSIRVIDPAGSVTCQIDDAGPWVPATTGNYGGINFPTGHVGIGDDSPNAWLSVEAPANRQPFAVRGGGITRLWISSDNGGVALGNGNSIPPPEGLNVAGDLAVGTGTLQNPPARLTLANTDWHVALNNTAAGGQQWHIGSSGDGWSAGGGKLVFSPTSGSGNAALVMDANRNVGIATVAPETRLHVKGGNDVSPSGGGYLTLGDTAGTNIAIDTNEIMARNNGAAATLALNANGGKVTMNSGGAWSDDTVQITGRTEFRSANGHSLVIGENLEHWPTLMPDRFEWGQLGTSALPFNFTYSQSFYAFTPVNYQAYSDRALKRNVRPIEGALDILEQVDGVAYELLAHPYDHGARELTDKERYDRENQFGFVAQDLESVLPQLVREERETGLKTVGYMGLIPILVEAVKTQQRQIEAQQAQIDALKRRLR